MHAAGPKLRIGIITDSPKVSAYVRDFLSWARADARLETTCIVFSPNRDAPAPLRQSSLSRVLLRAVVAIESLLIRKNKRYFNHTKRIDIESFYPREQIVRIDHGDWGAFKALEINLLVAPEGAGWLPAVTEGARLGSLSIRYGAASNCEDEPPGFWEAYLRDDSTQFQIISDEQRTLLQGKVTTQFYYLLNQAALFDKSMHYLKTFVSEIAGGDRISKTPAAQASNFGPRGFPSARQVLSYFAGLLYLCGQKLFRKSLKIDYCWHVALAEGGWDNIRFDRGQTIQNPSHRYLADPFLIWKGGKEYCFVEDYDHRSSKGCISVYEIIDNTAHYIGVALEEPFHLAFPFLFSHDGELYMCPDCSSNREIRIYRCQHFPLTWHLETIIMKDIPAADTMLLEKGGRWWLFANTAQCEDYCMELRIFHASSPFENRWTPHPLNPIYVDSSRARNAGLVQHGDRIFRIAQAQGFDMYGKSFSINEITVLDAAAFEEKRIAFVTPPFERGIAGTHHLSSNGFKVAVDFACLERVTKI